MPCAPARADHDRSHRAVHNVATALLMDPAVATSSPRSWSWWGVRVPGLVTRRSSSIIGYDPESVAVVLASGAPVTLVPLDVTTRTFMLQSTSNGWLRWGPPCIAFLAENQPSLAPVRHGRRELRGFWLHDPLALAYALDPAILTLTPMHVR